MLIKIYQPISCCWSLSIPSNVLGVYKEAATGGVLQKSVLKTFANFTEKHLCQCLFFNKVEGLVLQLFIKQETLTQMLSCEICESFKNTFFTRHLRCWFCLQRYQ